MKRKALCLLSVALAAAAPVTVDASFSWGEKNGILNGVPFFSQRTGGWENDPVGTSGASVQEIGCAMVCTAMLVKYYGKDTDPGRLNAWLSSNSGYTSNGNLYWQKPAEYSDGRMEYDAWSSWTSANIATDNDHWSELNFSAG